MNDCGFTRILQEMTVLNTHMTNSTKNTVGISFTLQFLQTQASYHFIFEKDTHHVFAFSLVNGQCIFHNVACHNTYCFLKNNELKQLIERLLDEPTIRLKYLLL